jgi:hypothetical protein
MYPSLEFSYWYMLRAGMMLYVKLASKRAMGALVASSSSCVAM